MCFALLSCSKPKSFPPNYWDCYAKIWSVQKNFKLRLLASLTAYLEYLEILLMTCAQHSAVRSQPVRSLYWRGSCETGHSHPVDTHCRQHDGYINSSSYCIQWLFCTRLWFMKDKGNYKSLECNFGLASGLQAQYYRSKRSSLLLEMQGFHCQLLLIRGGHLLR